MLKITILTICPEYFDSFLKTHVAQRALELGLAEVEILDMTKHAAWGYRQIDDSPYGGGPGLILRAKPVLESLREARQKTEGPSRAVLLSPKGKPYDQQTARRLAAEEHLILICGHYEGIDARAEQAADEMISLGDYILSGGEPAAMVVADSVLRLLPGNLKEGSAEDESFEDGLLEYPQYTRPAEVEGMKVPEVLLSGNHEAIRQWRREESLRITRELRPDLLESEKGSR